MNLYIILYTYFIISKDKKTKKKQTKTENVKHHANGLSKVYLIEHTIIF